MYSVDVNVNFNNDGAAGMQLLDGDGSWIPKARVRKRDLELEVLDSEHAMHHEPPFVIALRWNGLRLHLDLQTSRL